MRRPSVIGSTLVMKGELLAGEDLVIEGTFEGKIRGVDGALSIAPFANVRGDIESQVADISGNVEGDCRGRESVLLRRTAQVNGQVVARELHVESGTNLENAVLSGRIRVATGEQSVSEELEVVDAA